jgi:hypothetical protein
LFCAYKNNLSKNNRINYKDCPVPGCFEGVGKIVDSKRLYPAKKRSLQEGKFGQTTMKMEYKRGSAYNT